MEKGGARTSVSKWKDLSAIDSNISKQVVAALSWAHHWPGILPAFTIFCDSMLHNLWIEKMTRENALAHKCAFYSLYLTWLSVQASGLGEYILMFVSQSEPLTYCRMWNEYCDGQHRRGMQMCMQINTVNWDLSWLTTTSARGSSWQRKLTQPNGVSIRRARTAFNANLVVKNIGRI